MGRLMVIAGAGLLVAGLAVMLLERFAIRPGQLPGDIVIRGRHGAFYFPVVTCILLSVILSLVAWLFNRR
jgi:hypothetical protein